MNRKIFPCTMLGGTLLLGAAAGRAQESHAGAPLPPPPAEHIAMLQRGPSEDVMFAGPLGERIELLGFEGMHVGRVVTGAPFSAVAISETKQTLADGNVILRTTKTNLFRDSQGRVRREVTLPANWTAGNGRTAQSVVIINDPVAKKNHILRPDSKTAETMDHGFGGMNGRGMKGPRAGAMNHAVNGKFAARMQEEIANGTLNKEDLGTQMIAGVSAKGTRFTRIIRAGDIGNVNPITIVSEQWYSDELQMVVMSKRNDPRFGETTYKLKGPGTMTNIQRSEPDAALSLFEVPSDYTVTASGMGRRSMMRQRSAPATPQNE